jgi:hypothetical protein
MGSWGHVASYYAATANRDIAYPPLHGGVRADGQTDGWDPTTGANIANQQSMNTSAAAGAATAFAIAKGDMRRVQDFYTGPALDGVVNINPVL